MRQLDVIESVRLACLADDGHDPLDEAGALRLKHQGVEGFRAWVEELGGFVLEHAGELALAVAPAARSGGLGGRLAEQATTAGATRAWSHGDHPAAARLASRHGWRRARELWVMRRPTSQPLPPLEALGDLRIRSYEPGDADGVLRVNATAFAGHPEQGALDAAGLAERMAADWFDPAGLLMAVDHDDHVVGFHWTKQHDATLGEVYVVAVGPDAQGRGLGRTLTLAGLCHLAEQGVDEVQLYVESDNDPARHIYSRLGFGHADTDTHVQYAAPYVHSTTTVPSRR